MRQGEPSRDEIEQRFAAIEKALPSLLRELDALTDLEAFINNPDLQARWKAFTWRDDHTCWLCGGDQDYGYSRWF